MTRWKNGAGVALLALTLGGAGCATSDNAALDGGWVGVEVRREGQVDPALAGHRLQIDRLSFAITRDGKLLFGGPVEVDPYTSPPEINFYQLKSKTLAGTWQGIYALQGDSLTICDNAYALGKPRPLRLEDCGAPGYVLFRFKRG